MIKSDNTYSILHLHSMHSSATTNIDSVTKFEDYIEQAKNDGLYNITFTEHGNIFEWYHKKQAIEKAGFKYIHAVEAYITETLDEKVRDNYHCLLFAANYEGFKELNRLVSSSYNRATVKCFGDNEQFYYTPRITFQELIDTSDNIIISTACMGGILCKGNNFIKKKFLQFIIRNKHRCFLEVQHHNCESQKVYNRYLAKIANKYGLQLLACTDTHSLNDKHMRGRSILQKSKNVYFDNEEDWDLIYKNYDELVDSFKRQGALTEEEYMSAIKNTNKLVDMVEEFTLDTNTKYPHIYENPVGTFKAKINKAYKEHEYLKDRYSRDEYRAVINNELNVYEKTKSIDFMLLQTYMREWEKENGVECGYGRGSVSGSEIAYTLGITQMDSMKFGLNFFRFMNPDRVTNADIDTDYSSNDREKVKYFLLHDHMNLPQIQSAEIITFNTIAMKGAIKDVCRALDISLSEAQTISDAVTLDDNKKWSIGDEWRQKYPEVFEYVDIIVGTIVSVGTHPSGVLVSDKELYEEIGLCSLSTSQYPVSMLNMKELDALMYVKLDILGLDNIGIINEACKMLGIERLTPDNTNLEDEAVWKSIRDDTTMIFQWESESAQAYLKKFMSEETIELAKKINKNFSYIKWLSFGNGLIRPGCASFRDEVANGHNIITGFKELDDFLGVTFGRVVMQEDIMQFLVKFCGYSDAESDNVRRCVDEDSLILMGNGNYKKIKDVCVGDNVQTVNKNNTIEFKPVVNVFDNGIKDVYELTTQHGYSIKATSNHKLLTQRGWIELKNITTDDFIMTPRRINAQKDDLKSSNRLSESDMYLIGMLIGDGCIKETQRVHFTNHEKILIDKFEDCVNSRLEGKNACKFSYSIQDGIGVEKIYSVYISSANYAKSVNYLLEKLSLKEPAAKKKIPDCIMLYPKGGKLLNLLAGLFNTDGGYNKGGSYLEYYSTSEILVLQIKSLLAKYNIYSYIYTKYVKEYDYDCYHLMISQIDSLNRFSETILPLIIGKKHDEFLEIINDANNKGKINYILPNECKNEIISMSKATGNSLRSVDKKIQNDNISGLQVHQTEFGITDIKAKNIVQNMYCPMTYELLFADYIPVRVKNIKYIKKTHVYDLEVADNHNYIANNLIVHNCIAKKYGTESVIDEIHDRFLEYSHNVYAVSTDELEKIFLPIKQGILDASSYAFSWNHSDAYSCIGYICGYLRYYHPVEFITAALNIFQDKEDKTVAIAKYAKKVNVQIEPIKFRYSRSKYSCDNRTIYKGIASIKFLNEKIAEELYELGKKRYNSFIDLLIAVRGTSVNSKQLAILIKLEFFSEFGEINELLKQCEIFDRLYGKKQIRSDKLEELEIPLHVISEQAKKQTDKLFKDFDSVELIRSIVSEYEFQKTSLVDKIRYQQEFYGYIQLTIPTVSEDYAYVQSIGGVKKKTVTLYRLFNGENEIVRIRQKGFENNPIKVGDIIKTIEASQEKKWKRDKETGEFYQIDEYETILKKWAHVK